MSMFADRLRERIDDLRDRNGTTSHPSGRGIMSHAREGWRGGNYGEALRWLDMAESKYEQEREWYPLAN